MASVTASTATQTPTKSVSSVKPPRAALADITNESSPVVGLTNLLKTPPAKSLKLVSTGESLLREQAKKCLLGAPAADAGQSVLPTEEAKGVQVEVVLDASGPADSAVGGNVAVEAVCSPVAKAVEISVSSSVVTYEDSNSSISSCGGKCADDDCSSAWSVQANASCREEEAAVSEEEEFFYEVDLEDYPFDEENDEEEEEQDVYFEYDGNILDNLCNGMARLGVSLPAFEGKHTRFVYNSDGEMAGEEEVVVSQSKVLLKGMPVPQGKHLRFSENDANEV